MKKLAIITTHPIQYNAPLFKLLSQRGNVEIKVFYTWSQSEKGKKFDPGFNKNIEWDIPLMEGYDYKFINNISSKPGSHHFFGINNPTLINEINLWKADAIMIYGWAFISHLKVILYFKNKIPVYFRGDSTLISEIANFKSKLKTVLLKYIYSKITTAFYVGLENKKYFEKFGIKNNSLVFMPHAVDNARFAYNDFNYNIINNLKVKLGIQSSDFVFLFAGKFEANKNPLLLLNAFKNFNSKNAHLIMVGNGELEIEMKKMSMPYVNIHFLNFQNQSIMPSIYALCNVYVLPSLSETWGLSINEAMAAGKAIIASSACGASPNLVHHNINGFVFKSNNIDELESAINFCLNNIETIKQFGEKSKDIISNYSYNINCQILESIVINEN